MTDWTWFGRMLEIACGLLVIGCAGFLLVAAWALIVGMAKGGK